MALAETPLTFPLSRENPGEPSGVCSHLRADRPLARVELWDGSWAWAVSRYADVRAVLVDPRFSADMRTPGYPDFAPGAKALSVKEFSFLRMDPPDHDVLRKLLIPFFTVKRLEGMRPRIREIVRDCLRETAESGPPVDLVATLALPLPSLVICELLGVPYEDHESFQKQSAVIVSAQSTLDEVTAAFRMMRAYLAELVVAKRGAPGPDMLSHLIANQPQVSILTNEELVAIASLMLVAGHETTANMIGLSTLTLLRHPDLAAGARDDPEAIPALVEDLLRYHSIVQGYVARAATADVEVGGELVRAGEGVLLLTDSANHDESVFKDTGEVKADSTASRHVAFGYGIHQCLGQTLARIELQEAIRELLLAFPTLRLDRPDEAPPYRKNAILSGLEELPVAW